MITAQHAETFERCMAVGGLAVFPADTVYGIACAPESEEAVHRLYELKRRKPDKPAAVMLFSLELAFAALPEIDERTRMAVESLLPGALTVLLPNPARRFPLACGPQPETVGLRVPALPPAAAGLHAVRWPVMQSSANLSGESDPRTVDDVPERIRDGVDLVLDAGELPGTPSTVVDLRAYGADGSWRILRQGAVPASRVEQALRPGS